LALFLPRGREAEAVSTSIELQDPEWGPVSRSSSSKENLVDIMAAPAEAGRGRASSGPWDPASPTESCVEIVSACTEVGRGKKGSPGLKSMVSAEPAALSDTLVDFVDSRLIRVEPEERVEREGALQEGA
jgi:hypothetical protein